MRGAVACLTCLVAIAMVAIAAGPPPGAAADRDCGDFSTQADAQRFHDSQGPGDPHQLDADGDGVACETNPCPCEKPGGGSDNSGGDSTGRPKKARVKRIVDGDTIDVRISGRRDTVRIIGIDTPEAGDCGYEQASASLARSLNTGERVKLVRDGSQPRRDRYGRMLRYVEDGPIDTGRKQLLRGWARVLVVGSGFDRLAGYRKAVRKAKRRDKGIWGRC